MEYNRREFIAFLGKASLGALVVPPFLIGCGSATTPNINNKISTDYLAKLKKVVLKGLAATDKDDLVLTNGLNYHTIIKWGDKINDEDTFGFNNDFTCFIPLDKNDPKDGLLWVNHEYINSLFVSNFNYRDYKNPSEHRTIEQVNKEMYNVGGSIVRVKEENGK